MGSRQLKNGGVKKVDIGKGAVTTSKVRNGSLLTNREIAQQLFVTPKTVENHLGRAYVKLGIGSREALANVLAASE